MTGTPLRLSRSVQLSWDPTGQLVLHSSVSREPLPCQPPVVHYLQHFAAPGGSKPEEAARKVAAKLWPLETAERTRGIAVLEQVGEYLRDIGVLVADDHPVDLAPGWFAELEVHVEMLHDQVRTGLFREAIGRVAKSKVVVDVGAGTGVLSAFAARAGAKKVYAVEESRIASVLEEGIGAAFADRVEVIRGAVQDSQAREPADVVVCELLGSEPLAEGMWSVLHHAWRIWAAPEAVCIPSRLRVMVAGAWSETVSEAAYTFEVRRTEALALSDLYELPLGPLADAYAAGLEQAFWDARPVTNLSGPDPAEAAVTEEGLVIDLTLADLGPEVPLQGTVSLVATRDTAMNAAAIYFHASLLDELTLSTSPFRRQGPVNWRGQTLCPLPPRPLRRGREVRLRWQYTPRQVPVTRWEWDD